MSHTAIPLTRTEQVLATALTRLKSQLHELDLTLGDRPVSDPDALVERQADHLAEITGAIDEALHRMCETASESGPLARLSTVDGLLRDAGERFAEELAAHARLSELEAMAHRRRGEWPAWLAAWTSTIVQARRAFTTAGSAFHAALAERAT